MAQFQVNTLKGEWIDLEDNNEIHRGGEGRILIIDGKPDIVAKLYHQGINNLSQNRFEQLQKLDKNLFIKPLDLLFQNNQIVGFTMHYAGKDFFPLSSLFTKNFCQRNGIDNQFKLNIANQLIEAVKSAHFNGFIIGDLNQYNILLNLNAEIRLIDIDSYETPGHKHTGILLDDIRDYYYNGAVSMNSDYFALSVLLFNLLTFTHPFKGIHDKYKSLAERMINKIPVFVQDPLLKIPKCYEPIQNNDIQVNFAKQYLQGERFLFSLTNYSFKSTAKQAIITQTIQENEITLQVAFQDHEIRNVYFNKEFGYIRTNKKFIIYQAKNKGYINKQFEIKTLDFDDIYLGNDTIIGRKNDKLLIIKNAIEFKEIKNFTIPENASLHQMENILIVVGTGQMYWLYLDEVLNNSIKTKRTEVFSEAIMHHNGLLQNTGGIQRMFYNTGKDIATLKTEKTIKKIFQNHNTGMVQYIENKHVKNKYFKVNGLKIEYFNEDPESFLEYAYMQTNKDEGFIFEQGDNKIKIRRSNDFKIISEISCSYISAQTSLFYTSSGIVAWENEMIYLINQNK